MIPKHKNTGFSFTEVLFAVIILGIGFILVAAIFPVATQQRNLTVKESTAATIARTGFAAIARSATAANFPFYPDPARAIQVPAADPLNGIPEGKASFGVAYSHHDARLPAAVRDAIWNMVAGENGSQLGNYGWCLFWQRRENYSNPNTFIAPSTDPSVRKQIDNYVTLIIVTLHRGNNPYTGNDVQRFPDHDTSTQPATIEGKPMFATTNNSVDGDTISFAPLSATEDWTGCISEGAIVVVSDDLANGYSNGRVYKLGTRRNDIGALSWEMVPGNDMESAAENFTDGIVFVVGKVLSDPTLPPSAGNQWVGFTQEVSVYQTVLGVR